jgi:hypothetical protein
VDQHLQLTCPGCGAVVGLTSASPLVVRLRPFVEEHRNCGQGVDQEMRSAFSLSA